MCGGKDALECIYRSLIQSRSNLPADKTMLYIRVLKAAALKGVKLSLKQLL